MKESEIFQINGFLHLKAFFKKSYIDSFRKKLAAQFTENTLNTAKQIMNIHESCRSSELLLNNIRLVQLAEELSGSPMKPHSMHFRNAVPHSGSSVAPHQDADGPCFHPASALTMWIPLGSYSAEHGSVFYYPQSHWGGYRKGLPASAENLLYHPVAREVEKGDILIHHHFTVHYSCPNQTCENRWALMLNFIKINSDRIEPEEWRKIYAV